MVIAAVVETQKTSKLKSTLKLDFKFDSMSLIVYSPNGNEVQNHKPQSIDGPYFTGLVYLTQAVILILFYRYSCWTRTMSS